MGSFLLAMATEPSAIQTAVTTMAGTVATDAVDMLTAIVPVAAPIIAAGIATKFGIRWVRRLSN